MLTPTAILFDARIQKEAVALQEAGYTVTILSIEDQQMSQALKNENDIIAALDRNMPGVKSKRYFLRSRTWKFLPGKLNRFVQGIEFSALFAVGVLRYRSHIYHCHDLIPAAFCWLGKWLFGARIVYDAHELEVEMSAGAGGSAGFMSWYEKRMMKMSDLVITVNDSIRDIMESRYQKPVHVVQNRPLYTDPEKFNRQKLRTLLPPDNHRRIVMYVGFLAEDRGIDELVLSLKHTSDNVHFVIMGTGRIDVFRTHLEAIMQKERIAKHRVFLVNPVPPAEVIDYLCGADISVMLYQRSSENTAVNAPNKLYQSICACVPILASRNASFPPIVERSEEERIGITVDERHPEEIAKGIMYLLQEEVQTLCRANLRRVAHTVSWNAEKENFLDLYKKYC